MRAHKRSGLIVQSEVLGHCGATGDRIEEPWQKAYEKSEKYHPQFCTRL